MARAVMDAWEVVLKDFKITQNKSNPFLYAYSIDFTAVRVLGEGKVEAKKAPTVSKPVSYLAGKRGAAGRDTPFGGENPTFWQKAAGALANIEKFLKDNKVINAIKEVRDAIQKFDNLCKKFQALIDNTVDLYLRETLGIAQSAVDVYNTFKDATHAPAEWALQAVNATKNLRLAVESAVKDTVSLPEQWEEEYGNVGKSVESEKEAYEAYFEDSVQEVENAVNDAYAEASSGANPEVYITTEGGGEGGGATVIETGSAGESGGGAEGDDGASGSDTTASTVTLDTIVSYGFMRYIATSETSLERLAELYLGDPDKARMLAIYNGLTGDDEINPGDQIKIPILSENSLNSLNQIFGSVNNRDALGVDIALANGIIEIGPNGDFVVKQDYENMEQAITMRLSESIGSRIRLSVYGIRNIVGVPDSVASAYIATSIKDTIIQDPRISGVENLVFNGSGDTVRITFDYTTNDGVLRRYEGVL